MKRIFLAISAAAVLYAPAAFAQAKLVEKVERSGKEVNIPFEKYVLPNGLTLIVHEDHSDPIVHVDVTYHVGSAREEIGKSGFAHFFEHMMFQGSDNVADEQHFKIITEAGGTLNGTTNRDRTNYFETVPSNQLEKMLWLEADRMGFLLDAVTQKKFEVQRATVKNERGQNYDNRPYGLVGEVSAKNLYPYGHPYSWLTIGYIEDLNRVDANDLKNFFLRWYGPNNAVVTVGGDVNTKDVVKMVEKYFGTIPQCPKVDPVQVADPVVDKDRYISMTDNYAKLPMLRMTFPGARAYSADEAPLDCLAEILGDGQNSYFYKHFVKSQMAVNANVFHPASELSGEFTMTVMPFPGKKLSDMEAEIRKVLEEFEKNGPTDDDIEKFRKGAEAQTIYGLESVSGKVSQLASYFTFTGDANYIKKDMERYQKVTKADVMRVYNKYIKGKHAVILSVMTKGNDGNIAGADNYTVSTEGYKAPNYGYNGLVYHKAKDNFDRSVIPAAGANPVVKVPAFWRKTLPSNINAIGTKSDEIPVVNISIKVKGGQLMDANTPDKAGLANIFTSMMEEDTKNYTAEQFSVELDKLGSTISFNTGVDGTYIQVRSLKKNLDKTMKLLEERMLNPKFTEEAFSVNKNRIIESIKNSKTTARSVAEDVFGKVQYGPANPFGWQMFGTEKTVANIQLADVEKYHQEYFNKSDAMVTVVGDISEGDATKHLGFLQKMAAKTVTIPSTGAAPAIANKTIYFVDIPNAAQTEFRVGYVTGMKYDALGDYYKSTVMNYPFGGAFNSRLNLDLREDKGWTYGARSYFGGDKYTGTYVFSAGIKANATDSAMMDVIRIMNEYKAKGITADELKFTQNSMGQSEARKYELGWQKANFLRQIMEYNLPADFSTQQNDVLNKLTVNDINALATRYIPDAEKVNIVLVGDKAKVWDGLNKLGYQLVELDKDGNTVSKN